MIQKIYIARHGFRLNWLTSNWTSETGLPRDPPLAAYGVTQAQELAQYFASLPEDQRPTAIFSSPYYRCLQTAQPTSIALDIPIYVEHGLSEWYSPVAPNTGLHPRPGSSTSLQAYFKQIDPCWSSIWYPSRRGEGVDQVLDRVFGFLDTFVPYAERVFGDNKHERILLVSHAATIIALARGLMGDRQLPIRVGCCSLSEFVHKEGQKPSNTDGVVGRWKPLKLADGAHLAEGASRDWGFEDIEVADGKVVEDQGEIQFADESEEPVGCQIDAGIVDIATSNL